MDSPPGVFDGKDASPVVYLFEDPMAQPALKATPDESKAKWLTVEQVAERMDCTTRAVRGYCANWRPLGLAQKVGSGWSISPWADSRLHSDYRGSLDLSEQIGLLRRRGVLDKYINVAKSRAKVVEAFRGFCDRCKSLPVCEARIAFIAKWSVLSLPIEEPISIKTLERWERFYRHNDLAELVPQYKRGDEKSPSWHPDAKAVFYRFYFGPSKMKVATCYEIMRGEAIKNDWKIPSLRSVQRHIAKDVPKGTKTLYREGNQSYRAKVEPKIKRDLGDLAAGEHIEGDERNCDFYVRVPSAKGWKRIRPIMTAWIDRRSRIIFGWWLDARGNSDTILASFKRGVLDYGRPAELTIDNGEDYKSVAGNPRKGGRWSDFDEKRLRHCFSDLDIKVHLTRPYTPWSKGQIERFFATMAERFDKTLESYCGNKPENRPPGLEKMLVEDLPTLDEVRGRFGDFLEAYHAKPHSGDGMNGLSPSQAHELYRLSVAPVTPETLDYLCSKRIGPKKVGQHGIVHRHVHYGKGQVDVLKLLGRKVWLRLLPDVADKVWVEDENGTSICVAEAREIRGATQDDIRTAEKLRKERKAVDREYFELVVPNRNTRPIDDIHEAQRIAASADQIETPEPPTPATVRLTRPDIDAALARNVNPEPVSEDVLQMPSFTLPEDEEVIETGNAFARSFEEASDEILEGPDDAGQRLRNLADAG